MGTRRGIVTEPAAAHGGQLRALTITRPKMLGRLVLAWRTEGPASPAARAFIDACLAVTAQGSGSRHAAGRMSSAEAAGSSS